MNRIANNNKESNDVCAGTDAVSWTTLVRPEPPRISFGFESLEERRATLEWLSEGLRPGKPGRLISEFPMLFDRNASAIHITQKHDSGPIAFCTLWAVTFRIGVHPLRVGLISNVYTDPQRRGEGHASRVVNTAVDHAESLGLGVVLLWSELDDFYRGLGFDAAGEESLLVVNHDVLTQAIADTPSAQSFHVMEATAADWPEIERLRGFRTCQLELDAGELGRARTIPDLSVRVAKNDSGVQAFAMRGKGDDLIEVIHEWGGDVASALHCCRDLVENCHPFNELFLMAPVKGDALAWALRQAGSHVVRQSLGLMHVASPRALAADLSRLLPDTQELVLKRRPSDGRAPGLIDLQSSLGACTLPQSDFLAAIFGSGRKASGTDLSEGLREPLGQGNLDHLPLPFFVSGLESI